MRGESLRVENDEQSVFTKESDKYQWLVLEQKSQCEIEVRQTKKYQQTQKE